MKGNRKEKVAKTPQQKRGIYIYLYIYIYLSIYIVFIY